MECDLEDSVDVGFSDDKFDGVECASGLCSKSDDGNLNMLAVLLDESEEQSNSSCLEEVAKTKDVETESALRNRIKEMEKELATLRQQVSVHKNVSTCTNTKADQSKTLCTSSKNVSCKDTFSIPEYCRDVRGRNISPKILSQRSEAKAAGVVTEKYSGLRIKNPLISSEQMKKRMEGRKMVRLKCLSSRVKNGGIEGDWVTIGVVVDKLPPRDTVKGKKFAIWKLSDLSGQTSVVSLFLFGAAFQSHWKISVGTVIAILNPNNMSDREGCAKAGGTQNLAFSIDNSMKLMIMGSSQDYTTCKGVTKAGKRCSNFANLSDGGYCDYHVRKAYDATRSHRMECQNGYGPSAGKGTLKEKLFHNSKTEVFYYGGQSFAAPSKICSSKVIDEKQPSTRLFAPGSSGTFSKIFESQRRGARILAQRQKVVDETKEKNEAKSSGKSPLQILNEHCSSLPLLGKGLRPGTDVDLSTSSKRSMAASKRNAVKILNSKSSVDLTSEQIKERIRKSRGEIADFKGDQAHFTKQFEMPSSPKKQKKSLAEHYELINAKSSHDWVNQEVELDKEEEYFDRLEKKEAIELKKDSITELKITVVQCRVCKYTAESPSQLCSKEGHSLSRMKVVKRGFSCKKCNEKSFTYDQKWPVHPCKKCGANSYSHSSLYYERKGPLLPTEQLLVRGIEEKFLR